MANKIVAKKPEAKKPEPTSGAKPAAKAAASVRNGQSAPVAAKKGAVPAKKAAPTAKKTTVASAARPAEKATAAPAAKAASSRPRKSFNPGTPTDPASRTIPPEATYLFDQAWLDGQRAALLAERAKYTSSADRLAAEAAALMADREPGDVQFDEESGEGDTIAVERDRDLALSAAARQAVADIDAALERLDNRTYGLCLAGDDVIPMERLEAIPEASVCVQHKTSMF